MRRNRIGVIGALALVCIGAWIAMLLQDGEEIGVSPPVLNAEVDDQLEGVTLEGEEVAETQAGIEHVPFEVEEPEAAPESAQPKPEPLPGEAVITGRVLRADGTPAVGALAQMHGWGANNGRIMRYGKPKDFEQPQANTDAQGRFEIRFVPPQAFQFTLDVSLEGFAAVSWRWSRIQLGERKRLGDIELPEAGIIVGRVVNPKGEPVLLPWQIYAESKKLTSGGGRDGSRVSVPSNRETGTFRLEGVRVGPAELKAYARIINWIDGPTVEVKAGEEAVVEIVYDGPDVSRRIAVTPFPQLFYTYQPAAESIVLMRGGTRVATAVKVPGSAQTYAFDDLQPDVYTVVIEDDHFVTWEKAGVRPGEQVSARLTGSAAVQLTVLDSEGEPIPSAGVRIQLRSSRSWPNTFQLLEPGKPWPEDGLFSGIPPSDSTIYVSAEGHAETQCDVDGLKSGEVRSQTLRLSRGATIHGVLKRTDGTGVAGATVNLRPAKAPPGARGASKVIEYVTDAAGAFRFDQVADGQWMAEASLNDLVSASAACEVKDGVCDPVSIELPSTGNLRLTAVVPDGASAEGLEIKVTSSDQPTDRHFEAPYIQVEFPADGVLLLRDLPVGKAAVALMTPPTGRAGASMVVGRGPESIVQGTFEIEAGATLENALNLRAVYPATVRVRAHPVGLAPGAVGIALTCERGPFEKGQRHGHLDAEGQCVVDDVYPGTWSVTMHGTEQGSWTLDTGRRITVEAGGVHDLVVDVEVITATLSVVDDATGEPVSSRFYWRDAESEGGGWFHTDRKGQVRLTLPRGRFVLYRPRWRQDSVLDGEHAFVWPLEERQANELRIRVEK